MAEQPRYFWHSGLCSESVGQCITEHDPSNDFAFMGFIAKCQPHIERQALEGWTDLEAFEALKVKTQDMNYAEGEIEPMLSGGSITSRRFDSRSGLVVITVRGVAPDRIKNMQARIDARLGAHRVLVK